MKLENKNYNKKLGKELMILNQFWYYQMYQKLIEWLTESTRLQEW